MFALGGLVLWGLFLAPRARSPAAPDLPWSAPVRPLRFVSIDFLGYIGAGVGLSEHIRKLDPDYVLVQNVRFDDVHSLAEALGMARSFHPQLFQRADPRAKEAPGDLVLSKHRLYDAAPATVKTGSHRSRGVRAVAVFDGARFVVASGMAPSDVLGESSRRPIVLATGSKRCSVEDVQAAGLTPRAQDNAATPLAASLYADASWTTIEGFTVPSPAPNTPTILYAELRAVRAPISDRN